jgi:hypothetical protein
MFSARLHFPLQPTYGTTRAAVIVTVVVGVLESATNAYG